MGVTPLDAQNKKFDPNFHQAVDTVKIAEGKIRPSSKNTSGVTSSRAACCGRPW